MSYNFANVNVDTITWMASEPPTTLSTYLMWVKANDEGGGGFARALTSAGARARVGYFGDSTTMVFGVGWTTTFGQWTFVSPATPMAAWHHYAVVYDAGSTSNDPVIYVDGSSVTVTEVDAPAGSFITTAEEWRIGNRPGEDRGWNGRLAEIARVNRLLSGGEVASQAGGQSAAFLGLSGSDRYVKLINSVVDEVTAEVGSVTGATTNADHPTITYPTAGTGHKHSLLLGVG